MGILDGIKGAWDRANDPFEAVGDKIVSQFVNPDFSMKKPSKKLFIAGPVGAAVYGVRALAGNKWNERINQQRTGGVPPTPLGNNSPSAANPAATATAITVPATGALPPNWDSMTIDQKRDWYASQFVSGTGSQTSLATKLWQDEAARTQAANDKFLADEAARLGIGKEDPNLRRAFETAIGDLRAREAAALPSIQLAFQAATDQANRAAGESLMEGRGLGSQLFSTYNTAAGAIDNSNALTNANFADLTGGTSAGVTYADANDFASLLRAQAPSAQAYAQGLGSVLANSRLADAQTSQMQSAAEQAAARNLATRLIAEQTVGYQEREAARQQQLNDYISSLRAQAFRDQQDINRRGTESQIQIQQEGLTEGQKRANDFAAALVAEEILKNKNSSANAGGSAYETNLQAANSYGNTAIPYGIGDDGKPIGFLSGVRVRTALSSAALATEALKKSGASPQSLQNSYLVNLNNALRDEFGQDVAPFALDAVVKAIGLTV